MEPFYYQHLTKSEQTIYHAIKTGLTALEDHFLVPYADPARISMIFFLVRLDCPEIFYAVTVKLRKWPQSDNLEILPEYLFDKKTIRQQQKAMSARVEKLARAVSTKTELEKELYIHDFICENIHYDKLKKPYSHEIIGPLGHGVGVCEGIAKSVKVLCDALGVWCIIVISEANPKKKIKYRHAWNIVKIGKTYYHLDATFDLSLSKTLTRHDYFNLSDDAIFRDHEPIMTDHVPCTDGSHFYYLEKKLSFTKQEEVKKRAAQAAKKKKPFLFHWRGGYLTREILKELLIDIEEAAKEKGKQAKVSLNWKQAVIYVEFEDMDAAVAVSMKNAENLDDVDSVEIEQANEGELL